MARTARSRPRPARKPAWRSRRRRRSPARAQLNGKVDPNGVATTFVFQYGTSKAYGLRPRPECRCGPQHDQRRAPVGGLQAHTTYHSDRRHEPQRHVQQRRPQFLHRDRQARDRVRRASRPGRVRPRRRAVRPRQRRRRRRAGRDSRPGVAVLGPDGRSATRCRPTIMATSRLSSRSAGAGPLLRDRLRRRGQSHEPDDHVACAGPRRSDDHQARRASGPLPRHGHARIDRGPRLDPSRAPRQPLDPVARPAFWRRVTRQRRASPSASVSPGRRVPRGRDPQRRRAHATSLARARCTSCTATIGHRSCGHGRREIRPRRRRSPPATAALPTPGRRARRAGRARRGATRC